MNAGVRQDPFLQVLFRGFCQGMQNQAPDLFGPSLPPGPGTCPLMLFGSAVRPVRTLVVGRVAAGAARITCISVDRDETGGEEEVQEAEAGRALPRRETVDPFLACVDERAFGEALEAEKTRPLDLPHLRPFCTKSLLSRARAGNGGAIGLAVNLNHQPGEDVDGVAGMRLACEEDHDPVRLDLSQYSYGRIFGNHENYCRYSSTARSHFSWNLLAQLMEKGPDAASRALWARRLQSPGRVLGEEGATRVPPFTAEECDLYLTFTHPLNSRHVFLDNRRDPAPLADLPVYELMERRCVARSRSSPSHP